MREGRGVEQCLIQISTALATCRFADKKQHRAAFCRGEVRVLRGGLNDADSLRRVVVMRVVFRRVRVKRKDFRSFRTCSALGWRQIGFVAVGLVKMFVRVTVVMVIVLRFLVVIRSVRKVAVTIVWCLQIQ